MKEKNIDRVTANKELVGKYESKLMVNVPDEGKKILICSECIDRLHAALKAENGVAK